MKDCYREIFSKLDKRYEKLKQTLALPQDEQGVTEVRLAAGYARVALKELMRISLESNA